MDVNSPPKSADDALAREFDLVVAGHERRLGQFLVQMVGDRGLAEDLLQETFLVAFRESEQLRQVENVTAWLFTIARNRALHALRIRRRREAGLRHLVELFREVREDPNDAVAVRELLERHLGPDERVLLILRYIHGFDSNELGQIVDASPEAVRQRLSRTRRRLLDVLSETTAAQPAPRTRRPVELAGPDIAEYRLEDAAGAAEAAEDRRLRQFLAPLMTVAPAARRPAAEAFSWRRLRRQRNRSA